MLTTPLWLRGISSTAKWACPVCGETFAKYGPALEHIMADHPETQKAGSANA